MNSKPSSSRGVCQSLDARIGKENKFHSNLPGPGTYGVPWAASEDKTNQSTSTVGMLEGGGARLKAQPMTGSDLSPGQYKYASSIEQLLNKTISKRGPYDLFTGDRHKYSKALVKLINTIKPKMQILWIFFFLILDAEKAPLSWQI